MWCALKRKETCDHERTRGRMDKHPWYEKLHDMYGEHKSYSASTRVHVTNWAVVLREHLNFERGWVIARTGSEIMKHGFYFVS